MISLPLIIAIFFALLFGIIAVFFSYKEEKIKNSLKQNEKNHKRMIFENTVLNQVQENIGYSLDAEKVMRIIEVNAPGVISFSSFSLLRIKDDKILFEMNLTESVGRSYVESVKSDMIKSLGLLMDNQAMNLAGEEIKGASLDEKSFSTPLSFFNIPIVANGKAKGIINVASTKKNFYSEKEMTEFYRIVSAASSTLSSLENIILKEDGKLAGLLGSLDTNVIIIDANKRLVMINQPAVDFLNIQKPNPSLSDVLSNLPSSYNFADKIEKSMSLNQKIVEKNINFQGKNVEMMIIPITESARENDSKVSGASIFIHDMTPEKSLAKMKEDFTNIIVHELRSPLTSIKASSEMLNGENALTEEEKKKLIAIVYDQTCKMLNEVSMILDAAKLDSGLFSVHKVKGDLKKAISDSAEAFRPQAQSKFINLVTNIDPFLPQITFDAPEIKRVVTNLLTNSIKFTPGGGTITVRAWTTPDKIYVGVSDTGTGIAPEKQHLLFAKFAQIQTPNATIGTGLGLYIAKGIVEAHNGEISVQTQQGKGTVVTFWIPNTSGDQLTHGTPPPAEKQVSPLVN